MDKIVILRNHANFDQAVNVTRAKKMKLWASSNVLVKVFVNLFMKLENAIRRAPDHQGLMKNQGSMDAVSSQHQARPRRDSAARRTN